LSAYIENIISVQRRYLWKKAGLTQKKRVSYQKIHFYSFFTSDMETAYYNRIAVFWFFIPQADRVVFAREAGQIKIKSRPTIGSMMKS
jgi:hypothetical protein